MKKFNKIFSVIIFVFIFVSKLFSEDRAKFNTDIYDYNWPIKAKPFITSSFAEYRATHFHAGIDISTEHAIGLEVYSARDGYVKNITVSPSGYGRYIVVKHKDNFYTTYAHLQSFRTDIEKKVLEAQQREKSYSVEISFQPDEFIVKKGELIAFSGESGAGPPHLHFEIRDHLFNPVNPLLFPNMRNYVDLYPPVFKKVAFTPLNDNSFVNHELTPQIFLPTLKNSKSYLIRDTMYFTGTIGISTDVFDRTSERGDKITIYGLELYVDGKPYFISQRNTFLTAQYGQVSLYFDWNLLQSQIGRFHTLYIDAANSLSFYPLSIFAGKKNEYSGKISLENLSEGFHNYSIRAIDYNGTISECNGVFVLNHPPALEVKEISTKSISLNISNLNEVQSIEVAEKTFNEKKWDVISYGVTTYNPTQTNISVPVNSVKTDLIRIIAKNKYGTESFPQFHIVNPKYSYSHTTIKKIIKGNQLFITLNNTQGFTKAPSIIAYDNQQTFPVTLIPRSPFEYEGIFTIPSQADRKIFLKSFVSIGHYTTELLDSVEYYLLRPEMGLTISSPDNKFYFSFEKEAVYKPVSVLIEKQKNGNYSINAKNIFLRNGMNMQIKFPDEKIIDNTYAVYVLRGSNPIFLSNNKNINNKTFIVKRTTMLGEYVILSDKKPPEINNWRNNKSFSKTSYLFNFKVSDNLSGIDANKIAVYLDDVRIFPAYDPEKRTVSFYNYTESKIEKGKHIVSIDITDRVGNYAGYTKTIWTN